MERTGAYKPVTKRAIMTMVKTCIVPCTPTTKKRNYPIDLGNVGIGPTHWRQTHKLLKEWLNDGWLDKPKGH